MVHFPWRLCYFDILMFAGTKKFVKKGIVLVVDRLHVAADPTPSGNKHSSSFFHICPCSLSGKMKRKKSNKKKT